MIYGIQNTQYTRYFQYVKQGIFYKISYYSGIKFAMIDISHYYLFCYAGIYSIYLIPYI